ncbi:hypothetical protein HFO28_21675 [Rhizobium leguminosarum]|uniref:hypothetical protein n=1 Tax=Rhizobium leguminosarum TaxID=384 RepID=UPI001C950807|nr:hypothetical protein [Rhizobium leguminosarum]MBY5746180.1 hypothetical protein [Rhizobium leguminosarum]
MNPSLRGGGFSSQQISIPRAFKPHLGHCALSIQHDLQCPDEIGGLQQSMRNDLVWRAHNLTADGCDVDQNVLTVAPRRGERDLNPHLLHRRHGLRDQPAFFKCSQLPDIVCGSVQFSDEAGVEDICG